MKFDVVVIGSGPGGVEAARILARKGKKVGLVEGDLIGGTCLNRGCIPAKTMLFTAEIFREAYKLADYGINLNMGVPSLDFSVMKNKREEIMSQLGKGLMFLCKKDGVEFIEGYAKIVSENTVQVGEQILETDYIIVATGGEARKFPGFVEGDPRFLTSNDVFKLNRFPRSIVIVGGGPIGTEFATYFRSFGVEVTIVDMAPNLLNLLDDDIGRELTKSFQKDGISVHTGVTISELKTDSPRLQIKLNNETMLEADIILSAIGVAPRMDFVEKEMLAVNERGWLQINENLQTSVPNIYALGDVIGKTGTAYGAEYEGRYIASHILGEDMQDFDLGRKDMPSVVFTTPEVASCGWTEKELKSENREYKILKGFYLANGKAVLKGDSRGFCKIIVDAQTEVVLGVQIIGLQATELIHMACMVIGQSMTASEWRKYVWAHPVLAEVVKSALGD